MGNRLGTYIKKKILRKDQNLISLESPYEVIRRLLTRRTINTIVDAGASNGHVSGRFLRLFPEARAYGFEPNAMYRAILEEYAGRDRRFHPEFEALSDHVGTEKLYVTKSPGNTSLLSPGQRLEQISPGGHQVVEVQEIAVTTLDAWAKERNIERVELMKFDIQGGELKALKGASELLKQTLAIYAEVWFNGTYENIPLFGDIDAYLRTAEFVLYDLYRPKYGPKGLLMWANALWIKSDLIDS
ncbi:MAG: FkbM family methyltransferase [Sedimentisphaerales bacterium]|nr:FkbM family methyltransferase [Sedimentisphaerales bacterium]